MNVKRCFITKTPLSVRQGCNIRTVRACRERNTHRGSLDVPEDFDVLAIGVINAYIIARSKVTRVPSQFHIVSSGVLNGRNHRLSHSNWGSLNIKGCFVTETPISVRQSCNVRAVRTCGERRNNRGSLDIPENLDVLTVGIIDSYIIARSKVTRVPSQLYIIPGRVPIDRSYRLRDPNLRSRIGKCWSYQAILERLSSKAFGSNLNLIVPLNLAVPSVSIAIHEVDGITFYARNKDRVAFRRIAVANNIPCLHSRQSVDFIPISSASAKNLVRH